MVKIRIALKPLYMRIGLFLCEWDWLNWLKQLSMWDSASKTMFLNLLSLALRQFEIVLSGENQQQWYPGLMSCELSGPLASSMQIMARAGGRRSLHNNHPRQRATSQTLLSIANNHWSDSDHKQTFSQWICVQQSKTTLRCIVYDRGNRIF